MRGGIGLVAAAGLTAALLAGCGGSDDEFCDMAKNDGLAGSEVEPGSDFDDQLDDYVDRLDDAVEVAPDDIAEDVETIRDTMASVRDPSAVADPGVSSAWTSVRGWVNANC